jgi:hypothetical protein
MRIEGVRYYTVADQKTGIIIGVSMWFTATDNGQTEALYFFENTQLRKSVQRAVQKAIMMKSQNFTIVGPPPKHPRSNNLKLPFNALVSKGVVGAHTFVGKVENGEFSVRVSFRDKSGTALHSVDVPFSAAKDAGTSSYDGLVSFDTQDAAIINSVIMALP